MNNIKVTGRFEGELVFSHEVKEQCLYTGTLMVRRSSGAVDRLNVTVPSALMADVPESVDTPVCVEGQIRTYNREINGVFRLVVTLFAQSILPVDYPGTENSVELCGALCRMPNYRVTPFGREICDIMLAVNRAYGKCDYIPCVVWGANARIAANLKTGDHLNVTGRLQSREYQKLLDNGEYETREAIELSVFTMQQVENRWAGVRAI